MIFFFLLWIVYVIILMLTVTVKDDNGKARIQTSPIPGLSKEGESTLIVKICSE